MKFKTIKRDGPARIGDLELKDKRITTPNILFLDTSRFKAPKFADIFISNIKIDSIKPKFEFTEKILLQKLIKNDEKDFYLINPDKPLDNSIINNSATIFIVVNALQLFNQSKKFVEFIVDLREKIGYQKLIYLPSIAKPENLLLLSYLGIDLFDSIQAIISARNKTMLFETGSHNIDELGEIPCNCPSCDKIDKKPSEMNFNEILQHNYHMYDNEIKRVRNSISKGNLRNLVETKVKLDPNLSAILRNLDANHYNFLEKRTPIIGKNKIFATTNESLNRPGIKRFQERVTTEYKKPDSTKILLLLPCSAKKPYSFSKSHKIFREKLFATKNPHIVHEVIITSPIGIVPRELELIYPASSYDIPVTGIWDENEKKMIRNLLKKYLENNSYEKIIAHLPKEIMEFINDIIKKPIITCEDHPTSKKSLKNLSESLTITVNKYDKVKSEKRLKENIECLASYQFGNNIANKLLNDCKIKGRYPNQKIFYDKTQLGMVIQDRGLISLTIDGADRVANEGKYWVKIYDDFDLVGSVFAPGIKNADNNIRIGDEVVVLKNNKLAAVGVAQMNGEEMKLSDYGEAVKVRHKI